MDKQNYPSNKKRRKKKTIHQTTCGTRMKGVNWQCYNDTRPFVQKQTFSQCKDAYYYFNSTSQFLYMIRNVAVVQRTPSAPKMSKITIFNIPPSTRSKEISIVDSERELRKKKTYKKCFVFGVIVYLIRVAIFTSRKAVKPMKIQWKVGTTLSQEVSRRPHAARQRPRFESYLRPFAECLPPLFLPKFLSCLNYPIKAGNVKQMQINPKTVKNAKSMPSFRFSKAVQWVGMESLVGQFWPRALCLTAWFKDHLVTNVCFHSGWRPMFAVR